MNTAQLVETLQHRNGWRRQMAQRLLIESQDTNATELLRDLIRKAEAPETRIHALRTLQGLANLDWASVDLAWRDSDAKVRIHGLQLAESFLQSDLQWKVREGLLRMDDNEPLEVLRQRVLTLGNLNYSDYEPVLIEAAVRSSDRLLREAMMTCLGDHEIQFLGKLFGQYPDSSQTSGIPILVESLAKTVFSSRNPESIDAMIALLAQASKPNQIALMDGIVSSSRGRRGQNGNPVLPVKLNSKPQSLEALKDRLDRYEELLSLIEWPEGEAVSTEAAEETEVRPLTETEQARFDLGLQIYAATCAACHQPHGDGQPGLAPPLRDSEWIDMSDDRLIRIVLHGAQGPMTVKGETYQLAMPGLSVFNDEQVASVLTYVRRGWEHHGNPVTPDTVKKVRAETADRIDMWTEDELLAIP